MLNPRKDASDLIFMHPDLTPEDRELAKSIFITNKNQHEKTRSKGYMATIEDKGFLKIVDYGIKAVLQHNIDKRVKR